MPVALQKLRPLLVSAGFIGLCALFYFLRRPSISLEPILYAEDGSIFLQTAIDSGLHSLVQTYAGYSHLLQRLVALFAISHLSPLDYPQFFLGVAWASYLLPLCCMEGLIRMGFFGRILRFSYIPYVFYPYGQETYLNLPNAYIFFPLGFILIAYAVYGRLLLGREASPIRVWPSLQLLLFLYGLVAVFTGPFAALYGLPLLVFVVLKRRRVSLTPAWLTLPVLLSSVQLFLSQLTFRYEFSTAQAIGKLLAQPDVLLDWFTIHLVSPLFGGYKPGWYLRVLPDPLQLLAVAGLLAVVVLAVRVVIRRMWQPALLYLAMFSTMVLSFSSLLVAVRRGVPIAALVVEDAGGRFFFWNTVLFLSILLLAFVLLVSDRRTRQGVAAKIMASWLIISIAFYHNNVSPRAVASSYEDQLALQCSVDGGKPRKIEIFAGPSWSFYLARPQIDKLCSDFVRKVLINANPDEVSSMRLLARPLDIGQVQSYTITSRLDAIFDSIGLTIGTYKRTNYGSLRLCLTSVAADRTVCSKPIDKSTLRDNEKVYFSFPGGGFPARAGEKLVLSVKDLDSPNSRSKGEVAVFVEESLNSPLAYAGLNSRSPNESLAP
jgi:hypothetical protein